jgi:hypothetical protein
MMSKRKLCIFVVLLVFAVVSITPMTISANTYAASSIRGIGASFGAAANVGPVSVANAGSITLSGTGSGWAGAGSSSAYGALADAITTGPAAAFANAICFRGLGGTADALTIGLGGFGSATANTFNSSC